MKQAKEKLSSRSPNPESENKKTSTLYFTLPTLFILLLILLKLPLFSIYVETIRLIITLSPMLAIVGVYFFAFYKRHRGEKTNRLKYYLLILKILAAIFLFYLFYAPGEFLSFASALARFSQTFFTLQGLIFLSGPIALISFFSFAGLFAYRAYQKKQGLYKRSLRRLYRRNQGRLKRQTLPRHRNQTPPGRRNPLGNPAD
jgi:TRAP-type uncharacterized transport system fused permease subunit